MELPVRKANRLNDYDYSRPGYYFITICTLDHRKLFWERVGAITDRPENVPLSKLGNIVRKYILEIPNHYPTVLVDHYVIMPNHVHLLLAINEDFNGRSVIAPTISTVVRTMKGAVSRAAGHSIWQRSFHDHIVRGEQDYQKIWNYIETNPLRWEMDCFYAE